MGKPSRRPDILSETDITAIRCRPDREWKASHQLQTKRVGRAAAPLNSGDVLALLQSHDEMAARLVIVEQRAEDLDTALTTTEQSARTAQKAENAAVADADLEQTKNLLAQCATALSNTAANLRRWPFCWSPYLRERTGCMSRLARDATNFLVDMAGEPGSLRAGEKGEKP